MIKKNNTLIVLLICCSISVIFAQNISDPGNLFFCNESGYVRVDEIAATSPRFTYNFYPSATSFTSIATYDNSQDSSVINLTSADLVFTGAPPNRSTTVYVQDDCGATTFTGKLAEIDDCDRQAGINSEEKAYLFSIRATPLVIRSVSIFSSTTQNYDVSVVIKDDVGSIIYRSPRATGQAISGTEITIPMNFTLAPGATYSITTDTRVVSFGRCFPTGILRDDSNIELVREAGEDKLGNPFFNLVFEKSSPNSCDRIPFTLTESCPVSCIQNAPTISGASACMGDNLVLMATPALGTSLPVYQWYADGVAIPTATSDTYTVPTTTAATEVIYTAKVTNSTSCNTDSDFSNELPITVSQIPTFTINAPAALCSSTFDLSTTVQNLNPSGATLNYHNAITNGGTVTNPVAAIGTTTYYLAATSNGCTSARKPVTVTVDEPIIITPPTISQVCSPANVDITGTVNVSGTSITYHNGTGGTGTSVSNPTQVNTSGIYSLKATNGVCTDVKNVTVTINELPSANLTGSPLVCIGSSGDLTLEITGGSGPYDFTYNSPSTTGVAISNVARISTFPVSEVGDYTLTSLTDNKGCAATNLTSMGSLDTIPSLQVTSPLATCEISPNTNFNVTFSISGGIAPYTVTRGGSAVGSVNGSGVFTETGLDGSSANAYSYTITSGLPCTTGPTYEVVRSGTQDCSCPVVGALSGTPSICNTVPLGAVTLSLELSGATSYNATITDPNGADFAIPSASLVTGTNTITVPAANVVAGAYVLKSASENGGTNCLGSVSSTANLTINALPTADISNGGDICIGDSRTLAIALTGTPNYTINYDYTPPTGAVQNLSVSSADNTGEIVTLLAGTYRLTSVVDGNTCTATGLTDSEVVDTVPSLQVTPAAATCGTGGDTDFSVSFTISGGIAPYTVTRGGSAVGSVNGSGVFTETGLDGSSANAYSYTITSGLPCTTGPTYEVVRSGTQDCSCPVVGILSGTQEICNESPLPVATLTLELSGAVSYNAVVSDPDGVDFTIPSASLINGINVITIPTVNIKQGSYTLKSVSENGGNNCLGNVFSTASVIINELPSANLTGSPAVCIGSSGDLTLDIIGGTGPYDFTYNTPSTTGVAINDVASTYILSVSEVGDYTLATVTDDKGCAATSLTGTGSIINIPQLSVDNLNDFCDLLSKTATISFDLSSGKPSYSATREDPASGSFINGNMYRVSFSSNRNTPYEYRVKDASGCSYNTDILAANGVINCSCGVTAEISTLGTQSICQGESTSLIVKLNGSISPSNYSFNLLKDGVVFRTITNQTGPEVRLDNISEEGMYSLSNIRAHCDGKSKGNVEVIVTPKPIANPLTNGPLCASDKGELIGTPEFMDTYFWDGPSGFSSSSQNAILANVQPNMAGEYGLIVEKMGCKSERRTTFLEVWAQPSIVGLIIANQTTEPIDTVTNTSEIIRRFINKNEENDIIIEGLLADTTKLSYKYIWTTKNSDNQNLIADDTMGVIALQINKEFRDNLTLKVTNGLCVDSMVYELQLLYPLFVPNAFSPNGDGTNDFWEISGLADFPSAVVLVFNRWGNKIFEQKNYTDANAWTGEGNAVGTYYYIIKLNKVDAPVSLTGAVTIVR